MRTIRGIADARMQQSPDNPQLRVDVDRSRMAQLGLTERDVTNALATSLAGTRQTAPNFWLNPKNGVSYPIVAQTPEYQVDTLPGLENLPVTAAATRPQVLGGLGKITARARRAPWSPTTTCCPRSISMPRPRIATWAASAATSSKLIRDAPQGSAARRDQSRCAARSSP